MIPKLIFTFYHDKNEGVLANWKKMCDLHPDYECILFDLEGAHSFLKEHDLCDAFDALIPYSYKSDLFRFAYLYVMGGIYVDIKYECVDFTFHAFQKEYLVSEPTGVQTCLLVSRKQNPMYKKCIRKICKHIAEKYYGRSPYDPTGPLLLSSCYDRRQNIHTLQWKVTERKQEIYDNRLILREYDAYREDLKKSDQVHYTEYWKQKNIYTSKMV